MQQERVFEQAGFHLATLHISKVSWNGDLFAESLVVRYSDLLSSR
jgi:hypothetical protein